MLRGAQDPLTSFPCECIIFSSPDAGNFKQVAGNSGLVRFVCPNWTVEELQLLEHGYGDRFPPEEVENRFERFGGYPRAVVANETSISESQEKDATLMLKGVHLWSDRSAMSADWPSSLLKARYSSEVVAATLEEAFNKYLEKNSWLESESKASAPYGYWFEHKTRSLFDGVTNEDVEIKALKENEEVKEIQYAAIVKKGGKNYRLADLKKLTNPAVLYRLPDGFPLIDYFNPPNNCFSLGVDGHEIHLDQAVDLCASVAPVKHQVNFVCVTPSSNYSNVERWQSFGIGSGGTKALGKLPSDTVLVLSRLVQFCMRFKNC
eukprot:gene29571-35696_t